MSCEPDRWTRRVFSWCCVIGIVIGLSGCEEPAAKPAQEARPGGESPSADSADPAEPTGQREAVVSPRVEPGTVLSEADFGTTLRQTGAKYVVVQVYLEACGPCMTEALHLTEKEPAWRKAGVAVLGLGMDETADGPKAFFEHTGQRVTYPLYLAPWFAAKQDVLLTPTVFIYSAGGEQLFRTDPEQAEDGIMSALTKKLTQLARQP